MTATYSYPPAVTQRFDKLLDMVNDERKKRKAIIERLKLIVQNPMADEHSVSELERLIKANEK
jgi:hypothetical protein